MDRLLATAYRQRKMVFAFVLIFISITGIAAALAILTPAAFAQFNQPRGYPPPSPFFQQPSSGDMVGFRFAVLLTGAVIGFVIGAFFSPALREFRRWVRIGIAALLVGLALFGPIPIGEILSFIVSAILFFVALGLGLKLGAKAVAAMPRPRPTSYGSAKWADLAHLRENGVIGDKGFWLGEYRVGDTSHQLQYEGARHLMTVAPTRSGKGVSSIIPNLLTYQGSAFVIDPKGENALITAFRRGKGSTQRGITGLGQNVVLLDPWDIAASKLGVRSSCFNPLDWIKDGDPDAAENAFLLADALVPMADSDSEDEARFWDEEAKALLTGIILYVATAADEAKRRHLGRVRDILVQGDDDLKVTLEAMFKHKHPVVSSTASRTASKDPKLRSSVFACAQSHTHFLDSPRIRENLSKSDFQFEDLKAARMSVYLILPADRLKTFDRWLRLLVQQAITVSARNIDQKPDKPVLFLLDEMASIGRLPSLEQAYRLMAGFGMQLWGIVQDLSQLAKIYGETGWQTFISNSGVIQYFGSRDKMTAEYFSTLCGVTTVEVHNFSWAVGQVWGYVTSFSSGSGGGTSSSSNSTSSSYTDTVGTNEAQRQLRYPDELMVLKSNQQVVFVENLDPISGEKIVWYVHPALKTYGVNLHESGLAPPAAAKAA
jgi:type IV secretion system protein VirD4